MWKDKLVVAGLITAFLLTGCGTQEKAKSGKVLLYKGDNKQSTETEYETCKVEKKDFTDEVTESAELEYTTQKSITMDVGNAILDEIKIKEGSHVKKGQVVATYTVDVDESDLEKQKLQLESERKTFNAQLKVKTNQLREAKRQLDAMKSGSEKSMMRIEYKKQEKELSQFKSSEASLKQKEKDYAELVADSNKTQLRSDVSGVVTSLGEASEGEPIEAGTVIATLKNSGNFVIKAENSAGALRYNMEVDVWLGGDRNTIRYKMKGKIVSADNLLATNNTEATTSGGGEGEENNNGAYVKVSSADKAKYDFEKNNVYIHYATKQIDDALVVDNEAVYSEADGENTKLYVYVVQNENLHKRYVVSTFSNDKVTLIDQGVEEGQTLAKDVVEDEPVATGKEE